MPRELSPIFVGPCYTTVREMPILIPVAAFLIFVRILRLAGRAWRAAALAGAIFCGTCVAAITELLSAFGILAPKGVTAAWLLIVISVLFYLALHARNVSGKSESKNKIKAVDFANKLDFATKGLVLAAGVIAALVGLTALMAAPSMWDAMVYHLPRVTMWMSDRNVGFFPTPDYLQLVMAPWSEYTMMHAILLSGNDRFVNLVQFFSYLGSIIGVSLIARQLGAGPRGQVLAAVVCATIPEGILEASGPMNTYVLAFWVTATAVFLLLWNEETNWLNTICIGLAAGLAILTKGTAYIYLPPLVTACWLLGTRETRLLFLKRSPVLVALILALNFAQYYRNYQLTGSPLGMPLPESFPRADVTNAGIDMRGTAANIIRNLSVHMTTPSAAFNSRTERLLRAGIELLGKDPDDPNSMWLDAKFEMNPFGDHEIYAGDPAHLVLFLVSLLLVFGKRPPDLSRKPVWYGLGVAASFVLLSAMLRWNPYVSRFHLAWFVLGSALIGLVLERYFAPRLATGIAGAVLAYGLVFANTNNVRALVPFHHRFSAYQPRPLSYFADQHLDIAETYIAAGRMVDRLRCRYVGIDAYLPDPAVKHAPASLWVYPLFAMFDGDGQKRTLWYVGVHNKTTQYISKQSHPPPCAVVCLDCANVPEKWSEYRSLAARPAVFGNIAVFSSEAANPK